MTNKLHEQRQRGILLPKVAIPGIRGTYSGFRDNLAQLASFGAARLEGVGPDQAKRLKHNAPNVLQEVLYPAVDRLLATLGDDYIAQAPDAVGLSQYPGGEAYYKYLIRRETSMDLAPDQIHGIGLKAMAGFQKQMQTIRQNLGFKGTAAEFKKQLLADKRLYANSPEDLEQRYQVYVDRIKPRIPDYFSQQPKAPYGVKRASPMAEVSMTYGYYGGGNYYYNGSNLDSHSLISAGFLIYHELIPGHHFHLALVKENQKLSAYRRSVRVNAFSEGWGNYGSHLALEMGMLDDPYDHYGWLLSNVFIAVRLVVDTGLNHKGWSLEQATRYMLENTFYSESQVAKELLRYSTDIQAQALAYKLGYDKILELRQTAIKALGECFDIRKFHAAMLASGTVSIPVLEKHIQWYIAEELKTVNCPG